MTQFVEFVSNHYLLSLIWVFLVAMLGLEFYRAMLSPVKRIGPQDATQLINREDALVLDIRNDVEFRKGHIAGARHLAEDTASKGDFTGLEKFREGPVIMVCSTGMTASRGARQMAGKGGFKRVYLLEGGMQAWSGANLPLASK